MADDDLHCAPAASPAPQTASAKTEIIDRGGGKKKRNVLFILLAFALIAGMAFTYAAQRYGKASASADDAIAQEDPSDDAPATGTGDTPKECLGEIAEAHAWYCNQFLPFAKIASADHDRIDDHAKRIERIERVKDGSAAGTHPAVWILLSALGVTVIFLVLQVRALKKRLPPG